MNSTTDYIHNTAIDFHRNVRAVLDLIEENSKAIQKARLARPRRK